MAKSERLLALQVGRGIASLMVVLHHCAVTLSLPKYTGQPILWNYLVPFGRAGVDFFFVLSGFIIFWIHEADIGRPHRLGHYLYKRVTRIYPVYWVVLVLVLAVFIIRPGFDTAVDRGPVAVLRAVFLVPWHSPAVVGVSWTLSHEMLFYLVFSVVILNRSLGVALLGIWLAALVAARFAGALSFPLDFLLHVKNLEFFLGMGVALLIRKLETNVSWGVLLTGAVVYVLSAVVELNTFDFRFSSMSLLYGTGAALIVWAVVSMERAGQLVVRGELLPFLGDASYSIYLIHFTVAVGAIKLLQAMGAFGVVPAWLLMVPVFVVALGAGAALHGVVERPLLKFAARNRPEVRSESRETTTAGAVVVPRSNSRSIR